MRLIVQDQNRYVLKANMGEEVISQLQEFCRKQKIEAGKFFAIGAVKEVKLGWYDVEAKEYTWKEFNEKLEIVSLLGNIAWMESGLVVHAHGSFSDRQMQLVGGHVTKLIVGAACEIMIEKLEGRIEKVYDEETGLNLMQ